MHGSLRAWNSMIQVSWVGQYLGSLRGILDFFLVVHMAFLRVLKKYLHAMINEELKYPCMFFF